MAISLSRNSEIKTFHKNSEHISYFLHPIILGTHDITWKNLGEGTM